MNGNKKGCWGCLWQMAAGLGCLTILSLCLGLIALVAIDWPAPGTTIARFNLRDQVHKIYAEIPWGNTGFNEYDPTVEVFGESDASGQSGRPQQDVESSNDVGCEPGVDLFEVMVPMELVSNMVVATTGKSPDYEPVEGTETYFDIVGCGEDFAWFVSYEDRDWGGVVPVLIFKNDWPSQEAVETALRNGEPVYGILPGCGNPVVINAHNLEGLSALPIQTATATAEPMVAPTITAQPTSTVTATATSTPEAEDESDDRFGCGRAYEGDCDDN